MVETQRSSHFDSMNNGGVDASFKVLEDDDNCLDAELDELQRLQNMMEDAETHEGIAGQVLGESVGGDGTTSEAQDDVDRRSVYVGNVDYTSTPQDLQEHFKSCGQINRITILVDKFTGHPKGFAYIEFGNEDAVQNAVLLSDTLFKGRQIKVNPKRKNIFGYNRGRGAVRGRPFRDPYRGRGRGSYRPYYRGRGGFARGYGRPY